MNEEGAINVLKMHLETAKAFNWDIHKMLFCDGFLSALNVITRKNYGFSGTDIFVTDSNGERVKIQ